jgi:hypothetical protein
MRQRPQAQRKERELSCRENIRDAGVLIFGTWDKGGSKGPFHQATSPLQPQIVVCYLYTRHVILRKLNQLYSG